MVHKPQKLIRTFPFFLLSVLLVPLLMAACSDEPVVFGITFQGRILNVTLFEMFTLPEIVYLEEDETFNLIKPSAPDNELVVFHGRVDNFGATRVQMDIDSEPPVLRTTDDVRYTALNTSDVGVPTDQQRHVEYLQMLVDQGIEQPQSGLFIRGLHEVQKDFGLEGWVVFEVPKGSKVKDFRWEAGGDAIRIDF